MLEDEEYATRRRQQSVDSNRKRRFGITRDTWEAMVAEQDSRCAICNTIAKLVIDHDHECCAGEATCGECIRGLLCAPCNKGLGHFADDSDRLAKAAAYLFAAERARSVTV